MMRFIQTPPEEAWLQADEPAAETPFIVEFCLVQGVGFTCMAYQDEDGKWRRADDNQELSAVVRVLK